MKSNKIKSNQILAAVLPLHVEDIAAPKAAQQSI